MFDGHIGGCDAEDPIFILGMPRTGTTLVERILDSHPQVQSAGELNNFSLELIRLVKARAANASRHASTAGSISSPRRATMDFAKLGAAYVQQRATAA